jgi:hypothetical protein
MRESMNQVLGSCTTTPYESRSKLTRILFILVIPIPHLYPPCYNLCVISYPLVANKTLIYSGVCGYFNIVTNAEEDIVTTTIMHFRTFRPETMDDRTDASGLQDDNVNQPLLRPLERRVDTREQSPRSLVVNDGDTDWPHVSIHDL